MAFVANSGLEHLGPYNHRRLQLGFDNQQLTKTITEHLGYTLLIWALKFPISSVFSFKRD